MARASGVLSGGLIRLAAEKDWGELAERVDGEPSSVGGSDGAGRTLLHYVLWKRAPVSLLGAVLDADSGAAHGIDRDGRYPLHFAMCGHDAGAKYSAFVSKLIEATPAAAEAKDKHGRVPLHYAYWREASREVICAVQEAAPGVVSAMDKAGKKPVRSVLRRRHSCLCRPPLSSVVERVHLPNRWVILPGRVRECCRSKR